MAGMNGEEKAAVILLHLDPRVMEAVLNRLGPDRGGRLRAQVQRLRQSPQLPTFLDQVWKELEAGMKGKPGSSNDAPPRPGAAPPAPSPREEPRPEAQRYKAVSDAAAAEAKDPLKALNHLSPELLARALEGENARPVALVLSYLEVDQAGEVFKRLPSEVRRDVSVLLTSPLPGIDVARRIAQALLEKARSLGEAAPPPGADDRARKLAEMLRLLGKADRMELLAVMQERDSAAAAAVREYLYLFEDLLSLDNRSVQKVLGEIDPKGLAMALKDASPEITAKVLTNLSKRAGEVVKEEMEFLSSAPADQVRQAQKAITDIIQRLDLAGELGGLA
jgi:flagellar motor switch protein FliG